MSHERNGPCPCGSGKKYKKCCGAGVPSVRPGPAASIQQVLHAFERGAMPEAQAACEALLRDGADHPDANHLCGLVSYRLGRLEEARRRLGRAAGAAPSNAIVHSNLSLVLSELGEPEAAEASARRALAADPTLSDAHNNLGTVLQSRGDDRAAEQCFRRAVELDGGNAVFVTNLASVHLALDRPEEAEAGLRRALELAPHFPPALAGLGAVNIRHRRWDEARRVLEQAVQSGSREPLVFNNLGIACDKAGDDGAALRAFLKALELKPDFGGAHYNLGLKLEGLDRFRDAVRSYEHALDCGFRTIDALKSLLYAAVRAGDTDRACARGRQLLADPDTPAELLPALLGVFGQACDFAARATVWQLLLTAVGQDRVSESVLGEALMYSLYEPSLAEDSVVRLHRLWGAMVERRLGVLAYGDHPAARPASGRLRIAYLSPDFRQHSVGHFIRGVLACHDRSAFEVTCYSLTRRSDDLTDIMRGQVDRFVDVSGMDDRALAQRIHADGIQVLVDLTGHSQSNRLTALALRPAPVQLTWIGYLHTTGLSAVDYRITDPLADDPAVDQGPERRLRLPECFLCFGEFPQVEIDPRPPVQRAGAATFASFNNLAKITDRAVALWARLLAAVPGSRMMIAGAGAGSAAAAANLRAGFGRHGIGPERLVLHDVLPRAEYLRIHNDVDLVLDTFPFNGGTVTAGALWMGVPVVTLVGAAHRQRVGYSMLSNIGLPETIAWSEEQYLQLAAGLVRDPARLAALRAATATRTRQSVLCDAPRFTRQFEAAIGRVWAERTAGGRSPPDG